MNIKDLIDSTDIESVENVIKLHYGDQELPKYETLYAKLKQMQPGENRDHTTIFITAFLPGEEEDVRLEHFDEMNSDLCFDVCATCDVDDEIYSIASASYRDYLGFLIEEDTRRKFSPASILAHTLWEITAYSFEDNE